MSAAALRTGTQATLTFHLSCLHLLQEDATRVPAYPLLWPSVCPATSWMSWPVPVFSGHRPGDTPSGPCQLDLFLPLLLFLHQRDFPKCSFFHVSRPLHTQCSLPGVHLPSPYQLLLLRQSLNPKVPSSRWSPLPELRLFPQPGSYKRTGRRGRNWRTR